VSGVKPAGGTAPVGLGSSAALATIVVLALLLRFGGAAWQLPWELHPDEGHYVWKAFEMVQDGNLNPKYFRNPSLFTELLAAQFKLASLLGMPAADWPEPLGAPSFYVLLGRLTSGLLGAATVVLVWRLGALLLSPPVGLAGAALLAVCFLHVRDSQFATNDVPATFLLVLSVLCAARLALLERGAGWVGPTLLAGFFGGLASSTKYNAAFFVAPLLVAFLLARRRSALSVRSLAVLAGAGLLAILAYLAGTPFTLLAWPTFRDDFAVQARFAREGWEGQGPEPIGLLYLDALGQGLGWVGLGLAVLGLLVLARRRPGAAAVLGAYPLVYLGYMLGVRLFFARFAITVLPFLALAAAYGVFTLAGWVRRPTARAGLRALLLVGALAQPLWNDLLLQRIMLAPDSRVEAYGWLEANLPSGARLVVDDYSVRDRRPRPNLPDRGRFDLDLVNALSEHELDWYRQRGYQVAVSSSFQSARFPGRNDTYAELERSARLLARFETAAGARPFDIEDLFAPFHDLAGYARPGPTVSIYALDGSSPR
jgi:4-amino-4-deoxy-L-arabinose transferase-like glycosyltransferase